MSIKKGNAPMQRDESKEKLSSDNNNTKTSKVQPRYTFSENAVLAQLTHEPINSDFLSILTGLNKRAIKRVINQLRAKGERIMSDYKGGYWLASTDEEWFDFVKRYVSAAKKRMQLAS